MFQRTLAIVAVLLIASLFSTTVAAQVEGDFKLDIWLWPQTTASEASSMDIGLESWLNLEVELSGLTLSNHVAFGVAGIEHHIAALATVLGPLALEDEIAFAVPYIECPSYTPWIFRTIDYFAAIEGFDSCRPIGHLLFVNKRVQASMSLGGLDFSALMMFEDVNFPAPTAKATDRLPANPSYIYDDNYQTQAFRLGGIVELSGTTVSGIRITSKTGICADWDITIYTGFWSRYFNMKGLEWGPAKYIKKHVWYEEVCLNSELEFTKEYIAIEDISPVEGLNLNSYLLFKPDLSQGIEGYLNFNLSLFDIGRLNGFLKITAPQSIQLDPAYWSTAGLGSPFVELYLGNLSVIWEDVDADLAITQTDMITTSLSILIQPMQFLSMNQFVPTVGLVRWLMVATLSLPQGSPSDMFEVAALWEQGTWPTWSGDLELSKINFRMKKELASQFKLGLDAVFEAEGLSALNGWIKTEFAI